MTGTLRALVALDRTVDRPTIHAVLTASPDQLNVLGYVELGDERSLEDAAGDVLVVGCGEYGPAIGDYVTRVSHLHPTRPVVLMSSAPQNGHVTDAFNAGAEDILTLPPGADQSNAWQISGQMLFALEKAVARRQGLATAQAGQKLARMVCVLGLKGGSGKTLTAANMAVALAELGQRVAIVDLDLQFGDVGLAMGLTPDRTIYDLVRTGGTLDAEKLEDFLAKHHSGVRVLLAPARPDQAGVVSPDYLREVYPVLREMHDFVIIDTPPSFTPEVIAAVDTARDVCVVSMLDALSLKNTRIGLETLERLDYSGRVRLLLNRADSNVGISPSDVVAILGRAPDVLVPSDRDVTRAMNRGEPIALTSRRSNAARAFRALAALYAADPESAGPDDAPRPRRRLFRRS